MIYFLPIHVNDITAVEDYFTTQLFLIFYNLRMFHHYNNKVYIPNELIKVVELILYHILPDEWIINFQWTGKMTRL